MRDPHADADVHAADADAHADARAAAATPPSDGADWAALLVRAQDGDRQAYHAFLVGISPYLRAIARRYLGSHDIEDAVQEVLVVVHEIRHTYEVGRPIKPWLSTIASRRCIDLLRRRSRRAGHEVLNDTAADFAFTDAAGPEEHAAMLDAGRRVREAVQALSPGQRQAVDLVHLRELTLGEAAAESTQTTGALKVACHRALKTLRKSLSAQDSP